MKIETFLKLRVTFGTFLIVLSLFTVLLIPVLGIVGYLIKKTATESLFFYPVFSVTAMVGLVCAVGIGIIVASLVRDDIALLLKLSSR